MIQLVHAYVTSFTTEILEQPTFRNHEHPKFPKRGRPTSGQGKTKPRPFQRHSQLKIKKKARTLSPANRRGRGCAAARHAHRGGGEEEAEEDAAAVDGARKRRGRRSASAIWFLRPGHPRERLPASAAGASEARGRRALFCFAVGGGAGVVEDRR
jgi:hypothetical protein